MLSATPPIKSSKKTKRMSGHGGELLEKLDGGIPLRHSLAGQVVEIIQAGIQKRTWQEWLPSERALAESLHVSRSTLRAALAQLEKMGMVRAQRPHGTKILGQRKTATAPAKQSRIVALLTPEPITMLRPKIALIIDELRGQLAECGYRLRTFHGGQYFSSGANSRLQRLVAGHPHDCWVLTLAPDKVKKWFRDRNIPCVVSGTCDPDIGLPFVDLDYYALCRHAAGQMTGLGHKRIVFITENSTKAGDLESERGFIDGIAAASNSQARGQIMRHNNTRQSVMKLLDGLRAREDRPTAMLVAHPHFYILAQTYLHELGLRVPGDVSLMCRDDDTFLDYTRPVPTRYSFDSAAFARRLFKLIMQTVDGSPIAKHRLRIMPDYQKGATLAAPNSP
ncbi:DNA-binding LacI/PurR family transcriptional regulator [Ereboglobus sp. PH5-5]|uniref:LacI family DNA-binding transcriptional regulator n=1 Tax=Ereboglobus sp. PH5-5 TaxID=2940529 RepID=UPI0024052CA1|nr:LacI family DNA-binding transcriptional regulator [Ereboglobus sp. PH5-5]MDF9834373.1 DNA-binding LacI/PurR family transcriptional regulator [Ereboglobus sp. PH5-5]